MANHLFISLSRLHFFKTETLGVTAGLNILNWDSPINLGHMVMAGSLESNWSFLSYT